MAPERGSIYLSRYFNIGSPALILHIESNEMRYEFLKNLDTQWNAALIKAPCSHVKNSCGKLLRSICFIESKISQSCSSWTKAWHVIGGRIVDEVLWLAVTGGEAAENAGGILFKEEEKIMKRWIFLR